MRRIAGGLALAVALSGCSGGGASTTSTASSPTTTSLPATTATTTTTAAPTTTVPPTTTSTTRASTPYGDILRVEAVPWEGAGGTMPGVTLPRVAEFERRAQDRINSALKAFLGTRLAPYGPDGPPEGYRLGFDVPWVGEEAWPLLTVVFEETAPAFGPAEVEARFALVFDLIEGKQLAAADMLTDAGIGSVTALVAGRLAAVLGEGFCCFTPESLVADLAVLPAGLTAYLDETDGVPHDVGPLELVLPWAEVAPFADMREYYLAPFAVAAGYCSASGQEWALEQQPGLPEAVAAKRAAIFAAAAACDFEALEDLAGDGEGFGDGLANGVHPGTAEAFRDGESWGYRTLWWLLNTLNLPYAERVYEYGDGTSWAGYVWPAAQDSLLAEIPASERAALEAFYPSPLDQYGYRTGNLEQVFSGFHVNVTPDGRWVWMGFNIE